MSITTVSMEAMKGRIQFGLSTDTKTDPSSVLYADRVPSWFFETDTRDGYYFDGVNWVLSVVGGRQLVTDPMMDISTGRIPGKASVNKFGANTNIADGVAEIVWSPSGVYTFSTTADITHAVSSSASDTGDVEVQGLDTNWNLVTQTVTLNGTTGVALTTALLRVFRLKYQDAVTNVGVLQVGVGAVTSAFTAGNLRAQIDIGTGQTLMAIYTVPAGKTAYFQKYYGSMVGDPGPPAAEPSYGIWRLWAADRANGYAPQLKHIIAGSLNATSVIEHPFNPPPGVTEKTDIYITAQPEGDVGSFTAGFDLILVDD